jgi:hypothetical protein
MPSFYDWQADEQAQASCEVANNPRSWEAPAPRQGNQLAGRVNAVTGHVPGCACARCPGWYDDRVGVNVSMAPERKPRPLIDQVVPVAILMAMVTVCGMVLIPLVAPLLALTVVSLVAIVASIGLLAIIAMSVVFMFSKTHKKNAETVGRIISGEVVSRRSGWLRGRR